MKDKKVRQLSTLGKREPTGNKKNAREKGKKKNRFLLHQEKDEMGRKTPTPKYMREETEELREKQENRNGEKNEEKMECYSICIVTFHRKEEV